jgi:lysophospholipase L1-like esterase
MRDRLVDLGVTAASVVLFLAFCELVVFRFVLPGSDVPRNAFVNDLVRYQPNQTGVWRIRDEIAAPFSMNAQGWNSPLPDYPREKRAGMMRIAVVGDSFVEAIQVPVDKSFAEAISPARTPVEVFRYAISGAPMSQYVHMIEREVLAARPDVIVVMLVHNDFDESFITRPGRYTSSFMKLKIENGQVAGEILPTPWRPGSVERLRQTATARFFLYRWQVRPQLLADAIFGKALADGGQSSANIDVDAVMARDVEIRTATRHLVGRLAALARANGAKLLLAMDGDRSSIYAERPGSKALALNAIASETATAAGVPFVDLHPVFAADWARNRRRFEFDSDGHWNEYGHLVVAGAVSAAISAMPRD